MRVFLSPNKIKLFPLFLKMPASAALLAVVANLAVGVISTQVTVDTSTTYQTIDGFGFSEAFWFGLAVEEAPAAQQTEALNYMFSTTEGAGLTILRNRIAADPDDTIEPDSPGSATATPTYTWNDDDATQVRRNFGD
jgi:O-glycosyl hydrolase